MCGKVQVIKKEEVFLNIMRLNQGKRLKKVNCIT